MASPRISSLAASLALVGASALPTVATAAPSQVESAAESAAEASPVVVSISSTRVISMPTTVQPGVNRFSITSAAKRGSSFQLARPAEGYTAEEAARDIEKGLDEGKVRAIKRFEANVTLLGGVSADETADTLVVDLDPGSYWALDTGTNNPAKFFAFTVSGAETGNQMPDATTIKARQSSTWAASPRSIPNKGLLNFKNKASNNHFIVLVKLKEGKTYRDFKEWLEAAQEGPPGPPPVNFNVGLDSGVLSPGYSAVFNYRLPKGQYVMLCFWPDAEMGGMPHAFMGMHRLITLK